MAIIDAWTAWARLAEIWWTRHGGRGEELARARLQALVRHARERSPYYRTALGPGAERADLSDLPTLPKRVLMEQFDRVVTDRRLHLADLEAFLGRADAGDLYLGVYRIFSTSGTTGVPGLFLYSQAELLRGIMADAWNARGALIAFAAPLIAIAVRREPQWSLDVFVSRQAVFYTTTFMGVGAYLLLMAAGGYYVRQFGGS